MTFITFKHNCSKNNEISFDSWDPTKLEKDDTKEAGYQNAKGKKNKYNQQLLTYDGKKILATPGMITTYGIRDNNNSAGKQMIFSFRGKFTGKNNAEEEPIYDDATPETKSFIKWSFQFREEIVKYLFKNKSNLLGDDDINDPEYKTLQDLNKYFNVNYYDPTYEAKVKNKWKIAENYGEKFDYQNSITFQRLHGNGDGSYMTIFKVAEPVKLENGKLGWKFKMITDFKPFESSVWRCIPIFRFQAIYLGKDTSIQRYLHECIFIPRKKQSQMESSVISLSDLGNLDPNEYQLSSESSTSTQVTEKSGYVIHESDDDDDDE